MMCDWCLVLCAILTFLHAGAQKQQVKVACRSQPCKTGSHCQKQIKLQNMMDSTKFKNVYT